MSCHPSERILVLGAWPLNLPASVADTDISTSICLGVNAPSDTCNRNARLKPTLTWNIKGRRWWCEGGCVGSEQGLGGDGRRDAGSACLSSAYIFEVEGGDLLADWIVLCCAGVGVVHACLRALCMSVMQLCNSCTTPSTGLARSMVNSNDAKQVPESHKPYYGYHRG